MNFLILHSSIAYKYSSVNFAQVIWTQCSKTWYSCNMVHHGTTWNLCQNLGKLEMLASWDNIVNFAKPRIIMVVLAR